MRGEEVAIISKFPETGPQGLSSGSIKNLVGGYAPQRFEVIDVPIDVRNPDAAIRTLAELAGIAPVHYFDHHETDVPFLQRLYQHGIYASVFGDNVAMAAALELLTEAVARRLAIIGAVADRDASILRLESREKIESEYLPLANRLDVVVRQPQLLGVSTPGEVAELLARNGENVLLYNNISYPPEQLARELQSRIVEEGTVALLVNWADAAPQHSMWVPKTLEQLLLLRGRALAIAVVPGYNPRTRSVEGYDMRVLRYWLARDAPVPEQVVRDLIARHAITGNVVGHADYVSIRFSSIDDAIAAARQVYRIVEGMQPTVTHLVSDRYVAEALRRDFRALLEKITEVLVEQKRMYQEYLELKRRQVELLERSDEERRRRYD